MSEIWQTADEVAAAAERRNATVQAVKRTFDEVVKIIMARYGIGHQAAIRKMQQFDFSLEELQKVAAKNKTKTTVHFEQPKPDDSEPDDDADEKLDKLATAVQAAHGQAGFSKQQALAYAIDHFPEARELLRQSKQHSIDKYHQEQHEAFGKAAVPVPCVPLPNIAFDKMSDQDLSAAYREGRFDKLGGRGHVPPGPSRHHDGSPEGTHGGENTRPIRSITADHLTDVNPADSLVTMPVDEMNTKEGTEKAVKAYMARGMSYSAAVSAHHQNIKQARGW